MALSQPLLASELEALEPKGAEADSIQAFVDAWDAYFAGASVLGVPAAAGSYALGLSAMGVAMTGMALPNAAALKFQAGILTFWATIAPLGPLIWSLPPPAVVTPPLVPPAGIAAIAAALAGVWVAITASGGSLAQSSAAMAAVLHASGGIGGIAQVTIPPAGPVSTPIL